MQFVFDTNVLVSGLLIRGSQPAKALKAAEKHGILLYSEPCMVEIADVLSRPKLSKYIDEEDVTGFLARIHRSWREVAILQQIAICRDPKDDKFLELAVNGAATHIITGDQDLLVLHPYQDVSIVTPADFLSLMEST